MILNQDGDMPKFFRKHLPLIIVVAAVMLFFVLPLLFIQVPTGHDIYFHMERIESLADSIKIGDWFPRVYPTALGNQGYASPMFYGDLLLRIPALLVLTGVSVSMAYKIFLILIALMTSLISYFAFCKIVKDKKSAAFGTIFYALSSYFATDLFARAAIGEAQVFAFLPLAFLGFHSIMFGDKKEWFFLPIGLFLMLQCHLLSTVAFVVILAFFALFYIIRLIKSPSRLLFILLSVFVFFALSAYFLFPMLEQFADSKFFANDGTAAVKWGTLAQRAMPWWSVFSDFNYTNLVEHSQWIPNGVGLAVIPIWVFFIIKYKALETKRALLYLLFGSISLFMTTELFPWRYFQSLCGVMQFPWRLLVFAVFFFSLAAMYLAAALSGKWKTIFTVIVAALSLFSLFQSVAGKYERMYRAAFNNQKIGYSYNNNVGACEYLPTETHTGVVYAFNENPKSSDAQIEATIERQYTAGRYSGVMELRFSGNGGGDGYVDVPLVMYKGYAAITNKGERLEVSKGSNNRVRVHIGEIKSGTVTISYAGTLIQQVSDIISLTTVLVLLGFIIFKWAFKKRV